MLETFFFNHSYIIQRANYVHVHIVLSISLCSAMHVWMWACFIRGLIRNQLPFKAFCDTTEWGYIERKNLCSSLTHTLSLTLNVLLLITCLVLTLFSCLRLCLCASNYLAFFCSSWFLANLFSRSRLFVKVKSQTSCSQMTRHCLNWIWGETVSSVPSLWIY